MWTKFMASLMTFMAGIDTRDEEGQTAVEYALVIGMVSVAICVALAAFTTTFSSFWTMVRAHLSF